VPAKIHAHLRWLHSTTKLAPMPVQLAGHTVAQSAFVCLASMAYVVLIACTQHLAILRSCLRCCVHMCMFMHEGETPTPRWLLKMFVLH
jgi:hypothetical protein